MRPGDMIYYCPCAKVMIWDHTTTNTFRPPRVAGHRQPGDPGDVVHNNISELNLRRESWGERNWLFVGSDDSGEVTRPSGPCWPAAPWRRAGAAGDLCGISPAFCADALLRRLERLRRPSAFDLCAFRDCLGALSRGRFHLRQKRCIRVALGSAGEKPKFEIIREVGPLVPQRGGGPSGRVFAAASPSDQKIQSECIF